MSFCCLKHLPEEEAAEQQSELRPISPDPPGPSIPIALHACYGALSTPRGGCNLLRPLPFYLHCSSHTAVSGQAKPTCASGPLPRPSSPGVLVSLTHSRFESGGDVTCCWVGHFDGQLPVPFRHGKARRADPHFLTQHPCPVPWLIGRYSFTSAWSKEVRKGK